MAKTIKDRKKDSMEDKEDRRKALRLREEQRQNKYRYKYMQDDD